VLVRADNLAARGNPDGAIASGEQSVAILRDLGYREAEARALDWLADFHEEQSRTFKITLGDLVPWGALSGPHARQRHFARAMACWEQSAAIFRDLGDRKAEAEILTKLGNKTHSARAGIAYWEQSAAIFRELGDREAEASLLARLAGIHADRGRLLRGIAYWAQAAKASPSRDWRKRLRRTVKLFGLVFSYLVVVLPFTICLLLWTVLPISAAIHNGPSYLDWIALIAAVSAIALVLGTDGLQARALIAFPVAATAIFVLLSITLATFTAHLQSSRVWSAVIAPLLWMLVWWSYRAGEPWVTLPYLHTVVAPFKGLLRRIRSTRSSDPDRDLASPRPDNR
jgi:hypothetical protein